LFGRAEKAQIVLWVSTALRLRPRADSLRYGEVARILHIELLDVGAVGREAVGALALGTSESRRLTEEVRLRHGCEQVKGAMAAKLRLHPTPTVQVEAAAIELLEHSPGESLDRHVGLVAIDDLEVLDSDDQVQVSRPLTPRLDEGDQRIG
jgi:hypothetical protein